MKLKAFLHTNPIENTRRQIDLSTMFVMQLLNIWNKIFYQHEQFCFHLIEKPYTHFIHKLIRSIIELTTLIFVINLIYSFICFFIILFFSIVNNAIDH